MKGIADDVFPEIAVESSDSAGQTLLAEINDGDRCHVR